MDIAKQVYKSLVNNESIERRRMTTDQLICRVVENIAFRVCGGSLDRHQYYQLRRDMEELRNRERRVGSRPIDTSPAWPDRKVVYERPTPVKHSTIADLQRKFSRA